ncbi:hypothetical protein D2V93_11165 [Flagellimonas taeanensis]|uniref:hypothetical protein n=1 Tax=Flavobacteriaceae TaxID=49546 RepID=UPI000E684D5A|nr:MULTISPECIES: hypothetical protein [Allomuricauda]MDC6386098.1 hypothetical protein [Muricauda sp. SK9]RIV50331.1 hypothetical protein D2V93_11165 [Allomuricauda taeanensis]
MKKITQVLLTTIVFFSTSFTAQAQTEEETILWLEQYGLKMIAPWNPENYFSRMEIENNMIILREEYTKGTNGYGGNFVEKRININDFGKMFLDYGIYPPDANSTNFLLWFNLPKGIHPVYVQVKENYGYSAADFTLHFKVEDNAHRFAKAILHLAKLKGARPKPVVKENTF